MEILQTQNNKTTVPLPPPPPTSPQEEQQLQLQLNQKQHHGINTRTKTGAGGAGGTAVRCLSPEKCDAVVSEALQQTTRETAVSTTMEGTKEQKDQINFGLFAPTRVLKFLLSELKSKLNGLLPAAAAAGSGKIRTRLHHEIYFNMRKRSVSFGL